MLCSCCQFLLCTDCHERPANKIPSLSSREPWDLSLCIALHNRLKFLPDYRLQIICERRCAD